MYTIRRRFLFPCMIIFLSFCFNRTYAQPDATISVTVVLSSTNSGSVNLGSCSNFIILASSAISSTGGGTINGDVGLTPGSGTNITGLVNSQVNGTIYTVDIGGPSGSVVNTTLLTAAMNDLTTAYNDIVARTNPIVVDPGSGDIGGMTLDPGLYNFTSTAMITGTNVTLTGSSTDVWIFQIGSTLTVDSGIGVILTGGAQANNVFWQVGSSATLGTNSVFVGTILAQDSITMNTGSTIDGRLLTQTGTVTFNGADGSLPQDVLVPLNIVITVPTNSPTFTSLTNSPDLGGWSEDSAGLDVTSVTLRNNRDVAGFTGDGTTLWQFNGLPVYQGTNTVTAIANDNVGNSATDTLEVTYTGDSNYSDVLRSGNIVQFINFPDPVMPGQTHTVQWTVLSYVPIVSRIYAGNPGAWSFFRNGTYRGMVNSSWNLNGRHAHVYSFDCEWLAPQTSGEFKVWFNVAQMDSDQFMIPVIPDGVDFRSDPTYPKLIQRTLFAGGNGTASTVGLDEWDSEWIFETLIQQKERSAVTITSMSLVDPLTQGDSVTCQWNVQSYMDVNAQLLVLNLASSNIWLITNATQIGVATNTTYSFIDRSSSTTNIAKSSTFQVTFPVPTNVGVQQIYFRSQDLSKPGSEWMAENLSAGVDPRPVIEDLKYGRMIERTITP